MAVKKYASYPKERFCYLTEPCEFVPIVEFLHGKGKEAPKYWKSIAACVKDRIPEVTDMYVDKMMVINEAAESKESVLRMANTAYGLALRIICAINNNMSKEDLEDKFNFVM